MKENSILLLVLSSLFLIGSLCLLFITDRYYEVFGIIKPISLVQISGFITFALLLETSKPKFSREINRIMVVIAFALVMVFTFETLWSFSYWFSTYELKIAQGYEENSETLDTIYYVPSPNLRDYYFYENVVLNHSAKVTTLFLFMSIYLLYYLVRKKELVKNG